MVMRPGSWLRIAVAASVVALVGCGGEVPAGGDAGVDVGVSDGDMDAAPLDTGADAAVDARADAIGDVVVPAPPLTTGEIPWNASTTDLGTVAALAEQGSTLVLFGMRGMTVLAGGTIAATDARVTAWRTAAVIPPGDGTAGTWVVGVDTMGRVWRLRDRTTLEEVTGRYALMMRDARSVATLSMNRVAFGLPTGVAIADGTRVVVWNDPAFANLVGAGGRLAARTATGVRVFDVDMMRFVEYALPGVSGVDFNAAGRMVVTAGSTLYTENDRSEFVPRVVAPMPLRAVERAGSRVWLVAGDRLALWDGTDVRVTPDVMVASTSRLQGSPGGDVWVFAGGRITRYGIVESPDFQQWLTTVRPVFARRCTPCHLPGGTGNHDFTTYEAWVMGRNDVRSRVFMMGDMPPPPGMLTTDERAALRAWLDAPPPADGGTDGATGDVPRDGSADGSMDAAVDARADVTTDVAADVRPDVTADVATDVRPDVAADGGVVTYAAVDAIFQAACVRCHGTSGALNLSVASTAYTALVNTAAMGASCTGGMRIRVVPGDPTRSLLYLKLMGTQDCGVAMPRGAAMLTATQLDTVRRWIVGGAMR